MSSRPIPEFQPVIMALREQRIIAKADYWCCQTCAGAAIEARITRCKERGGDPIGVCYYHHQDRARFYRDGILYLSYDVTDGSPYNQTELGHIIAAAVRNLSWKVEWNGDPSERILVSLTEEVLRRWEQAITLSGAKRAAAAPEPPTTDGER